jgi:hypothetical protein
MKKNPHRWMFFIDRALSWQVDYFIQTQHVIGDASFHCRSYAQRLMTAVRSDGERAGSANSKSERTA